MNPDVFWHFSSARHAVETRGIPRADWMSSTRAGAPWAGMEWLTELGWYLLYGRMGFFGLWLLKNLYLVAVALGLHAVLKLQGAPPAWRGVALALLGAAALQIADLRADLSSFVAVALTLLYLERRRLGLRTPPAAVAAPVFALWASLHAGFLYGLALLGAATVEALLPVERLREDPPQGRSSPRALVVALASAFVGSLLFPDPIGQYVASFKVRDELALVSRYIVEWTPLDLTEPLMWPAVAAIGAFFAAAVLRVLAREPIAAGSFLVAAFFARNALAHQRFAFFAAMLTVPLTLRWLRRRLDAAPVGAASVAAGALAVWGIFLAPSHAMGVGWDTSQMPVRAADWLWAQRGTLGSRVLFNDWEHGGYLGWRLHPPYRVFVDGRYLFHAFLPRLEAAFRSPERFAALVNEHHVDVLVVPERPVVPVQLRGPGGGRTVHMPYWALFAPVTQWARVHADPIAVVFVRRSEFDPSWIAAHEIPWRRR